MTKVFGKVTLRFSDLTMLMGRRITGIVKRKHGNDERIHSNKLGCARHKKGR